MIQTNPLFLKGISEFQTGEYYRCHDSLEELWMDMVEPDKTFIQGILQVAVGCYHLSNGNSKGTMILLGEGLKRLKEYQPDYESIDVKTFVRSSAEFLQTIQSLDSGCITEAAHWLQQKPNHGDELTTTAGTSLKIPTLNQVI